jgi:polar amino acid transport system substrate-binding protein
MMKNNLPRLCVLFIAAMLAAGCTAATPTPVIQQPAAATADQTVILATGDWAPYTSETMENYGAFTEIVSAVFKEMGVPVKYVFYPWKRAEDEVKAGNVFAAFPYIETEDRLKEYDFSDPVFVSTGKFFYMPKKQKSEIAYDNLEDLQSYHVGGVLGYWYETPFKEAGLQTEYVSSDEMNIQKLYLGRVDLAASEELVGWALIKKLYPQEMDQFATVAKPLNEDPLRLLVSRKYPAAAELVKKFNAALKIINDNGIMQQILTKYGLKK